MNLIPKNRYRLHVSVELLLLMLFATSFFDMVALNWLFRDEGLFFSYLLLLVVIYIRNMGIQIRFGIAKKMKPLMWILIGALISFIPAYLYYGQHLYYSLIVYRNFFGYFALVVLLSIRPSHLEIRRALNAFSIIYFVMMLYVSFINPAFVISDPERDFIGEGDFVHYMQGAEYLVLALIYTLDDMRRNKIRVNNLLQVGFLFLAIFLIQNRTLLFASLMVSILAALSIRSASRRLTREVIVGFLLVSMFVLAYQYITHLITETMTDLNNPDYNRVKAFNYFISGENGFMSYIWGNGFISGSVNSLMADLRMEGIFHSDLGMIGFWNQFGIIPIIAIFYLIISGLNRKHSFVVRANALFVLCSVMTIAYFRNFVYSLWLCYFMYVFATDVEYEVAKKDSEERTLRRIIRRYRSLAD